MRYFKQGLVRQCDSGQPDHIRVLRNQVCGGLADAYFLRVRLPKMCQAIVLVNMIAFLLVI